MVKKIIVAAIGLMSIINLASCEKVEVPRETLIVGKGGMGIKSLYPMNSRASYYEASKFPIQGVEIDCQITKDGELIAYHDEFLNTVTNYKGSVYAYTWDELFRNCFYIDQKFKHYSLISVKEIISLFPSDAVIDLDCKQNNFNDDPEYISKYIAAILEIKKLNKNIIIESESESFLNTFRELGIDTYVAKNDFKESLDIAYKNHYDGIIVADYLCTEALVEEAKQKNIKIEIWQSAHDVAYSLNFKPYLYQTNDIKKIYKKN